MLKLIPWYWKVGAVILIAAAIFGGIKLWESGLIKKGVEQQAEKTAIVQKDAQITDLKNVVETERQGSQVSQEKSSAYQKDLTAIDLAYRAELERLRERASAASLVGGQAVSSIPGYAGGSGEEADPGLLAQELAETRIKLVETQKIAEDQAYQLLRAQEWIAEQTTIYNANPSVAGPAPD